MYHNPEKYLDYVRQLNQCCQTVQSSPSPQMIVVYGASDYLVMKSSQALLNTWKATQKLEPITVDGESLTRDLLAETFQSQGLFEPANMFIMRRIERRQDIVSMMSEAAKSPHFANWVVMTYHRPSMPQGLQKSFKAFGAVTLACHLPNVSQLPKFISAVAKNCGIRFEAGAIDLLQTHMGDDLAKLDNEIRKLRLIFADKHQALSAADISAHIGVMKEDDVFALSDLLVSGRFSQAHLLLDNLLARGENALAILGVLARHCRNLVRIADAKQTAATPREIASQAKLPVPVARQYMQNVNRDTSSRAAKALEVCLECDFALKSRKQSSHLLLGQVIDALASP